MFTVEWTADGIDGCAVHAPRISGKASVERRGADLPWSPAIGSPATASNTRVAHRSSDRVLLAGDAAMFTSFSVGRD